MTITKYTLRTRQRGLTLIELMIAVLLGLVLTGGMIQIFLGNRATYAFSEGLSRLQENARFALDHIANDARMAGYVGCLTNVGINNNLAAPNNFRDDIASGLQGYDALGTATDDPEYAASATDPAPSADENQWDPPLPAELDGLVIPGSDVLVVRRVSSQSNALVSPFSDADELYTTQPDAFLTGEILVVTDCQKATIFQVTNDPALGVTLRHTTGGGFDPANGIAAWPTEQLYGLGSEVAPLEAVAFFVGRGGNGSPALFEQRLRLQSASETSFGDPDELVDGIDTMQVRYGRDSDNNGTFDAWLTADEVTDWSEILSVEVSLLARATDEYGTEVDAADYVVGNVQFDPVNDRRLRRVFSTVIGLRNRLP